MSEVLVPEFTTMRAGRVRSILQAIVEDEVRIRARAEALAKAESLSVVQDRFLDLANRPEFSEFFAFLSRHADDLLAPCHWLTMGPNFVEARESRLPTAAELLRLVQLVRHQRPDLLDFVRSLVVRSPLADAACSASKAGRGVSTPRATVAAG